MVAGVRVWLVSGVCWCGAGGFCIGGLYSTSASNKFVSLGATGNWFFVTLGKTFINILVVKQSTYNANVSDKKIL